MKLKELVHDIHDEVHEIIWASEPFSVYEDFEDFKLLVLRRLEIHDDRLSLVPETFILRDGAVYYLDREGDDYSKLSGFEAFYLQLEQYYKNNQKIVNAYSNQIEKLEDYLFERTVPTFFMDIWFDVKKDLSKLENYYFRNGVVYREFMKKTYSQFGDCKDEFRDIEEGIQFQTSNLNSLKSRLDGVHHYYDSIKQERLNKTLLSLTLISGVFLPLNLIVGFFGINTPGLPFAQDETGTEKVLLIIGAVLFLCLMGFQIIHLIDRYILRFLLGRYDFYQNLSARLDELSVRFRGKRIEGNAHSREL